MQNYHNSYELLPSNGGWDGKQKTLATDGSFVQIYTADFTVNQTFIWGVGEPNLTPQEQMGSWGYSVLPFLEQQNIYQQRDWQVGLTIFIRPARRDALAHEAVPGDVYGDYGTGGWKWSKTDYAANRLAIPNRPKCHRLADFTDGLSQTTLLGEKAVDPSVNTPTTWYWDEPFFVGGSGGTYRGGVEILRDAIGIRYKNNWGSAQAAGAQFVLADGSVRLVPFGTPWTPLSAWLTLDGGEIVQGF